MKAKNPVRQVNVSLDDQLYRAIENDAQTKGLPISTLIVNYLKNLYPELNVPDIEDLLSALYKEALKMEIGKPFLLAELASFSNLIVATAREGHIIPDTLRARIGLSFNRAVRSGKMPGIERALTKSGNLKNYRGIAMFVHVESQKEGRSKP